MPTQFKISDTGNPLYIPHTRDNLRLILKTNKSDDISDLMSNMELSQRCHIVNASLVTGRDIIIIGDSTSPLNLTVSRSMQRLLSFGQRSITIGELTVESKNPNGITQVSVTGCRICVEFQCGAQEDFSVSVSQNSSIKLEVVYFI